MSAPSTGWYCYPWNLADSAAVLGGMRDAGMSHVTIAASYHAGKFLQPRDPVTRVYFPEDGTVYFGCDSARYGALKPRRAAITQAHDVLREACDAGTLPVRAWTVLNHNSRLGWLHPEAVARNAWGDPYYYSLCPANPLVRDYAATLCADLAGGYDLASLLLETPGWLTYDHGYHHEFGQVAPSPEAQVLLGLCFCDSCIAGASAAGIDAAGLREQVRTRCDALLAEEDGASVELAAFHAWRASIVTSLLARIRAEVRGDVAVRVISTCQRPHRTCWIEGGDLAAMDAATDGLELPVYQPGAAAAAEDLAYVAGLVPPDRLSVILRPGLPDMTGEAQLAETLGHITAAGIADISFYNYGLLPQRAIDWVERAVAALRSAAHA